MTDKINGRTPEEIKRGVECCNAFNACPSCPYEHIVDTEHGWGCVVIRNADTLALIQQLERERDEARSDLDTLSYANTELHSAYEAMKRERDVAVEAPHGVCKACIHFNGHYPPGDIMSCCKFEECIYGMGEWDAEDHWQWRGVQEV